MHFPSLSSSPTTRLRTPTRRSMRHSFGHARAASVNAQPTPSAVRNNYRAATLLPPPNPACSPPAAPGTGDTTMTARRSSQARITGSALA